LIAAATWLACATAARAREPDVHLVWQRPVGSQCPTREVLQADVRALMGRVVFGAKDDARVILQGNVEDDDRGVRVHIEARSARGELIGTRELNADAGQCASLRDAIGFVLTLFVEHEVPQQAPGPVLALGAALSLARVPMPRMAFALGPAATLVFEDGFELQLSAAYWLPVVIQTARGVGASLEALSLELRACMRFWAGLGSCAGVTGGALIAAPLELRGPERQARLLAHAGLELGWALPIMDALRVELAAGALLSLSRPSFSYLREDGTRMAVYRPQAAGAIFRLAVIIPTE
jgi:hypothetical protein